MRSQQQRSVFIQQCVVNSSTAAIHTIRAASCRLQHALLTAASLQLLECVTLSLEEQKAQQEVSYKYHDQADDNSAGGALANALGAARGREAPGAADLWWRRKRRSDGTEDRSSLQGGASKRHRKGGDGGQMLCPDKGEHHSAQTRDQRQTSGREGYTAQRPPPSHCARSPPHCAAGLLLAAHAPC